MDTCYQGGDLGGAREIIVRETRLAFDRGEAEEMIAVQKELTQHGSAWSGKLKKESDAELQQKGQDLNKAVDRFNKRMSQ